MRRGRWWLCGPLSWRYPDDPLQHARCLQVFYHPWQQRSSQTPSSPEILDPGSPGSGERQLCTLLQVSQLFLSLKPLRYQLQITHCLEGLGLLIPRWDLSLSRVAESSLSISVSPCMKIDYSASFPSTLSCPKPLGCLVTSLNFAFRYGLLE